MAVPETIRPRTHNRARLVVSTSPRWKQVTHDRDRFGRRVLGGVSAADTLRVVRYDDAYPDAPAALVTVHGETVLSACVRGRRDNLWEVVYCWRDPAVTPAVPANDAVYWRRSADGGRSWGDVTTVATGYQAASLVVDDRRAVAALWKESESAWYVTVGELNAGGTARTWCVPVQFVTGALGSGDLTLRRDGRGAGELEFVYVTTGGVAQTVRCRDLSKTATGTWS